MVNPVPGIQIKKFTLNQDGKSAEMIIHWDGKNFTVREKYKTRTTADKAQSSIEKTLPKMLALADIYSLGRGNQNPTTKITLKGKEVTRLGGKKQQKTYSDIDEHLQQKLEKGTSSRIEKISKNLSLFSKAQASFDHRVTTQLNKQQSMTALKVAKIALQALAGLVIFLFTPLLLAVGGVYALGKKFADYMTISKDPDAKHLVTANFEMKNGEDKGKHEAALTFYGKHQRLVDRFSLDSTYFKRARDEGMVRQVLRETNARQNEVEELLKDDSIVNRNDELGTAIAKVKASNPPLSEQDVQNAIIDFQNRLEEFKKTFEINNHLDSRQHNELILAAFRRLLESEGYQAMKFNASHPAIQFIHRFAASIWNVKVMDHYQEFGEKALKRADELAKTEPQEKTLSEAITASIKSVSHDLFQVRSLPELLMYTATHPLQTLYSIVSEGHWYSKVIAAIIGKYDPHGVLSNNPSLQGTTTLRMEKGRATINNVYGGSPTIGDEIAPEFLAVLQAAENNQFAEKKDHIAEIPDKVFYTNFQNNLGHHGEAIRSAAIMKLNELYPLSFLGITLTKDSDFYLMKGGNIQWNGADQMKAEMLSELTRAGSGYYFPGKIEDWLPLLHGVLDNAVAVFKDKQAATNDEAFKLRGAFIEYVYASLQLCLEVKLAQELVEKGFWNPHVHSQRACKENIDRGGAANAAYLNLRLGLTDLVEKDKQELVVGALHCRALGARRRMILPDRLPQVLAFIEQIDPKDFWEQQKNLPLLKNVNLEFVPGIG